MCIRDSISEVPASVAFDKKFIVFPYLPIDSYGTTTSGSSGNRSSTGGRLPGLPCIVAFMLAIFGYLKTS